MAYTTIDDPSAHFQCELYTGNSGTNAITFSGNSDMKPDLVWNKRYDVGYNHVIWNSSVGVGKYLNSNTTNAEATFNYLTSFDTDGVTFGNADQSVNVSGGSYILWNWKANGGTTSSNTDGSTTSTVQANTDAGFSIVTWTGTGSATTLGHGLGVAPAVLIVKNRSTAVDWAVYHQDLTNAGYVLALNNTDAEVNSGFQRWNRADPTSSVFSVGSGQQTNENTSNMIAYCFAEKQGYSKFGSYAGTGGGGTNGKFVYTGFRPALVVIKSSSTSANWQVYSNKRPSYGNNINKKLGWNNVTHENGSDLGNTSQNNIDFLSNGFRCTTANTDTNSSQTYIYMAFAESPFVTSTGIPTTAR